MSLRHPDLELTLPEVSLLALLVAEGIDPETVTNPEARAVVLKVKACVDRVPLGRMIRFSVTR